jgi:hypothetical protein
VDATLEEDFVENSPVERLRGRDAERMRNCGRSVYDANALAESARRERRTPEKDRRSGWISDTGHHENGVSTRHQRDAASHR